jgi:hypothetical protein
LPSAANQSKDAAARERWPLAGELRRLPALETRRPEASAPRAVRQFQSPPRRTARIAFARPPFLCSNGGAMKKILVRSLIVLVVLGIVAVVAVALSLNSAIKKGVETYGPQITKVPVTLESVNLSLFSGSGALKGLIIGNPEGYKTTNAMSLGLASVAIAPRSLFADKIVVKSIRIEAPQVTFEFGPGGNNLSRIQENLEAFTGGSSTNQTPTEAPAATKPGKKLQVDEVVITGGKVTLGAALLGGKLVEAPLPEIRLEKLGQGPEGITGAELGKVILSKINQGAIKTYTEQLEKAGAEALQNLSRNATNTVNKAASDVLNKASKGLNDLLSPKKKE